jgi:hypothetical protein
LLKQEPRTRWNPKTSSPSFTTVHHSRGRWTHKLFIVLHHSSQLNLVSLEPISRYFGIFLIYNWLISLLIDFSSCLFYFILLDYTWHFDFFFQCLSNQNTFLGYALWFYKNAKSQILFQSHVPSVSLLFSFWSSILFVYFYLFVDETCWGCFLVCGGY